MLNRKISVRRAKEKRIMANLSEILRKIAERSIKKI